MAKDAGDVHRLFDATAIAEPAETTRRLLVDDLSTATTRQARLYLPTPFATPRSPGIALTTQALAGIIDESTVAAFMTSYTRDLIEQTRS